MIETDTLSPARNRTRLPVPVEPGPPVADQRFVLRRPEVSDCLPELSAFVQAAIPKALEQDRYIDWLSSTYCKRLSKRGNFKVLAPPMLAIVCTPELPESLASARALASFTGALVPGWYMTFGLIAEVADVWNGAAKISVAASQVPRTHVDRRHGPAITILPEDQLHLLAQTTDALIIHAGVGAALPEGLPGIHGFARWLIDAREYGGFLHTTVRARRAVENNKSKRRQRNLAARRAIAGRARLRQYAKDIKASQKLRLAKYEAIAKARTAELLVRQAAIIAAHQFEPKGEQKNEG